MKNTLSPIQKNFLYYSKKYKGQGLYHVQFRYYCNSLLSLKKLQDAIDFTIKNHEELSSAFIYYENSFNLTRSNHDENIEHIQVNEKKEADEICKKEFHEDFNENSVLYKIKLICIRNEKSLICFTFHHSIVDFYSGEKLIKEVLFYYKNNQANSVPEVNKERFYKKNRNPAEIMDVKKYETTPLLEREFSQNISIERSQIVLKKNETSSLINLCKENNFKPSTLVMLSWSLLYYIYNAQKTTTVGYVRKTPEECRQETVFPQLSTFPLNVDMTAENTILESLQSIRKIQDSISINYKDITTEEYSKNSSWDHINSSIIDFKYQSADEGLQSEKINLTDSIQFEFNTPYPLFLEAYLERGCLVLRLNFNSALYCIKEIDFILTNLHFLIYEASNNTHKKIKDIKLCQFSNSSFLLEDNLVNFREQEVFFYKSNYEDKHIALEYLDESVSYASLYESSDILMRKLTSLKCNGRIGIVLRHTPFLVKLIVSLINLKITFIPIDPNSPQGYIENCLRLSSVSHVICEDNIAINSHEYIVLTESSINSMHPSNMLKIFDNEICYIIFTSGSTGPQKGVRVAYRSIVYFLENFSAILSCNEKSSFIAHTSIGFDIFYLEILLPLYVGGRICLLNSSGNFKALEIKKYLLTRKAAYLQGTPSLFSDLINEGVTFDNMSLICGGEVLSHKLASSLFRISKELHHVYGPTEATIWCSHKHISEDDIEFEKNLTIGKPINGSYFFICNEHKQLLPPMAKGELYIGGNSLASGYLMQDETEKKFHIFDYLKTSELSYQSGDIASQGLERTYYLYGRSDNQIKRYGHRLELSQIDSCIEEYEGIENASTIQVNGYLYTFYEGKRQSVEKLAHYLSFILPFYAIPNEIIYVDRISRSLNNKIDRQALINIVKTKALDTFVSDPSSNIIEHLKKVYAKLLHLDEVDISKSFFSMGGNSILAHALISMINVDFDVKLSFSLIYKLQSIEKLGEYLNEHLQKLKFRLKKTAENTYPLTCAQTGIYFYSMVSQDSPLYNLPVLFTLEGEIEYERLIRSIKKVIKSHRVFGIRFSDEENLEMHDQRNSEFIYKIISSDNPEEYIYSIVNKSISIKDAHKVSFYYIESKLNNSIKYLLFLFHHIIVDAKSIEIFFSDLTRIYAMDALNEEKEITLDFLDYAYYEKNNFIQSNSYKDSLLYWARQLEKAPNISTIAYDFNPQENNFSGDIKQAVLSKENSDRIIKICKENNVSIIAFLILALYSELSKFRNSADIVIGTTVQNRPDGDFMNSVGFYANTLPIRINCNPEDAILQNLEKVNDIIFSALAHQFTPFSEIIKTLNLKKSIEIHPLFQIALVYFNTEFDSLLITGCNIKRVDCFTKSSKFDMTIYSRYADNKFHFIMEYASNRYKAETAKHVLNEFINRILFFIENKPYS